MRQYTMPCRLCLKSDSNPARNIINSTLKCSELSLIDALYWVFGIDVDINDPYSKSICERCENIIRYVGSYRTLYQRNQLLLESKPNFENDGNDPASQGSTEENALSDNSDTILEDSRMNSKRLKFVKYYYELPTTAIRELIKGALGAVDVEPKPLVTHHDMPLFQVNGEVAVEVCKYCSQIFTAKHFLDLHYQNKHTRTVIGEESVIKTSFKKRKKNKYVNKKQGQDIIHNPTVLSRVERLNKLLVQAVPDKPHKIMFDSNNFPNLNFVKQLDKRKIKDYLLGKEVLGETLLSTDSNQLMDACMLKDCLFDNQSHNVLLKANEATVKNELKIVTLPKDTQITMKDLNKLYKWLKLKAFHIPLEEGSFDKTVQENIKALNANMERKQKQGSKFGEKRIGMLEKLDVRKKNKEEILTANQTLSQNMEVTTFEDKSTHKLSDCELSRPETGNHEMAKHKLKILETKGTKKYTSAKLIKKKRKISVWKKGKILVPSTNAKKTEVTSADNKKPCPPHKSNQKPISEQEMKGRKKYKYNKPNKQRTELHNLQPVLDADKAASKRSVSLTGLPKLRLQNSVRPRRFYVDMPHLERQVDIEQDTKTETKTSLIGPPIFAPQINISPSTTLISNPSNENNIFNAGSAENSFEEPAIEANSNFDSNSETATKKKNAKNILKKDTVGDAKSSKSESEELHKQLKRNQLKNKKAKYRASVEQLIGPLSSIKIQSDEPQSNMPQHIKASKSVCSRKLIKNTTNVNEAIRDKLTIERKGVSVISNIKYLNNEMEQQKTFSEINKNEEEIQTTKVVGCAKYDNVKGVAEPKVYEDIAQKVEPQTVKMAVVPNKSDEKNIEDNIGKAVVVKEKSVADFNVPESPSSVVEDLGIQKGSSVTHTSGLRSDEKVMIFKRKLQNRLREILLTDSIELATIEEETCLAGLNQTGDTSRRPESNRKPESVFVTGDCKNVNEDMEKEGGSVKNEDVSVMETEGEETDFCGNTKANGIIAQVKCMHSEAAPEEISIDRRGTGDVDQSKKDELDGIESSHAVSDDSLMIQKEQCPLTSIQDVPSDKLLIHLPLCHYTEDVEESKEKEVGAISTIDDSSNKAEGEIICENKPREKSERTLLIYVESRDPKTNIGVQDGKEDIGSTIKSTNDVMLSCQSQEQQPTGVEEESDNLKDHDNIDMSKVSSSVTDISTNKAAVGSASENTSVQVLQTDYIETEEKDVTVSLSHSCFGESGEKVTTDVNSAVTIEDDKVGVSRIIVNEGTVGEGIVLLVPSSSSKMHLKKTEVVSINDNYSRVNLNNKLILETKDTVSQFNVSTKMCASSTKLEMTEANEGDRMIEQRITQFSCHVNDTADYKTAEIATDTILENTAEVTAVDKDENIYKIIDPFNVSKQSPLVVTEIETFEQSGIIKEISAELPSGSDDKLEETTVTSVNKDISEIDLEEQRNDVTTVQETSKEIPNDIASQGALLPGQFKGHQLGYVDEMRAKTISSANISEEISDETRELQENNAYLSENNVGVKEVVETPAGVLVSEAFDEFDTSRTFSVGKVEATGKPKIHSTVNGKDALLLPLQLIEVPPQTTIENDSSIGSNDGDKNALNMKDCPQPSPSSVCTSELVNDSMRQTDLALPNHCFDEQITVSSTDDVELIPVSKLIEEIDKILSEGRADTDTATHTSLFDTELVAIVSNNSMTYKENDYQTMEKTITETSTCEVNLVEESNNTCLGHNYQVREAEESKVQTPGNIVLCSDPAKPSVFVRDGRVNATNVEPIGTSSYQKAVLVSDGCNSVSLYSCGSGEADIQETEEIQTNDVIDREVEEILKISERKNLKLPSDVTESEKGDSTMIHKDALKPPCQSDESKLVEPKIKSVGICSYKNLDHYMQDAIPSIATLSFTEEDSRMIEKQVFLSSGRRGEEREIEVEELNTTATTAVCRNNSEGLFLEDKVYKDPGTKEIRTKEEEVNEDDSKRRKDVPVVRCRSEEIDCKTVHEKVATTVDYESPFCVNNDETIPVTVHADIPNQDKSNESEGKITKETNTCHNNAEETYLNNKDNIDSDTIIDTYTKDDEVNDSTIEKEVMIVPVQDVDVSVSIGADICINKDELKESSEISRSDFCSSVLPSDTLNGGEMNTAEEVISLLDQHGEAQKIGMEEIETISTTDITHCIAQNQIKPAYMKESAETEGKQAHVKDTVCAGEVSDKNESFKDERFNTNLETGDAKEKTQGTIDNILDKTGQPDEEETEASLLSRQLEDAKFKQITEHGVINDDDLGSTSDAISVQDGDCNTINQTKEIRLEVNAVDPTLRFNDQSHLLNISVKRYAGLMECCLNHKQKRRKSQIMEQDDENDSTLETDAEPDGYTVYEGEQIKTITLHIDYNNHDKQTLLSRLNSQWEWLHLKDFDIVMNSNMNDSRSPSFYDSDQDVSESNEEDEKIRLNENYYSSEGCTLLQRINSRYESLLLKDFDVRLERCPMAERQRDKLNEAEGNHHEYLKPDILKKTNEKHVFVSVKRCPVPRQLLFYESDATTDQKDEPDRKRIRTSSNSENNRQ